MMKAVVLAGGRGSRLRRLTPVLPKPFAPVANRPVLAWVLDHLDTADVDGIGVIVPAAELDLFEQGFGQRTAAGTPIRWLAEHAPAGTGGALRLQAAFFDGDPALVVPADIISSVRLTALLEHHRCHRPAVTVAAALRRAAQWGGDVLLPDPQRPGHAAAYAFKPCGASGVCAGSTGAWVVDPAVLESIPDEGMTDFSSDVLPRLPAPGRPLGLFDTGPVYLRDIGIGHKLLTANQEAALGQTPVAASPVPGPAPVIEDGACIGAQVLIGPGARIGADARVTGVCVIGADAEVGGGAEVEGALLLPGAEVPRGARVGEEIIGDPGRALEVLLKYAPYGARS
ncbi:sugar phosphate nucleotidyltransferase [Streptomyces luteireticuli]|uniref:sugar phosphate nucleotidyltransferase n=1 Tax=Streptomyces luteireticuli TaxID=173858 RepID=UPI0035582538